MTDKRWFYDRVNYDTYGRLSLVQKADDATMGFLFRVREKLIRTSQPGRWVFDDGAANSVQNLLQILCGDRRTNRRKFDTLLAHGLLKECGETGAIYDPEMCTNCTARKKDVEKAQRSEEKRAGKKSGKKQLDFTEDFTPELTGGFTPELTGDFTPDVSRATRVTSSIAHNKNQHCLNAAGLNPEIGAREPEPGGAVEERFATAPPSGQHPDQQSDQHLNQHSDQHPVSTPAAEPAAPPTPGRAEAAQRRKLIADEALAIEEILCERCEPWRQARDSRPPTARFLNGAQKAVEEGFRRYADVEWARKTLTTLIGLADAGDTSAIDHAWKIATIPYWIAPSLKTPDWCLEWAVSMARLAGGPGGNGAKRPADAPGCPQDVETRAGTCLEPSGDDEGHLVDRSEADDWADDASAISEPSVLGLKGDAWVAGRDILSMVACGRGREIPPEMFAALPAPRREEFKAYVAAAMEFKGVAA